jgi:adenylate cyclase
MTERSDPEQLVQQLNEYFLEMVGAVLKENGTLQKFIGDAIMAAWGDVHTEGAEEDARRAVRTALDMRAALAKLNVRWQNQPNRVPLNIGMGVNTGEIIVGNIGHPQRMEFTVLGDGVNQAARFESATKQFHADLLVGESVEALTRKHFIFRQVGLLTVKGKTKPVEAFNAKLRSPRPRGWGGITRRSNYSAASSSARRAKCSRRSWRNLAGRIFCARCIRSGANSTGKTRRRRVGTGRLCSRKSE